MRVSYFPGCASHGTGKEFDGPTRDVCDLLGIELAEIPDWSCCGSSVAHSVSNELALSLAGRNLKIASQAGDPVLTPCAACFSRLGHAKQEFAERKIEKESSDLPLWHALHLFTRPDYVEKIVEKSKTNLNGLKILGYYGCLLTRPTTLSGLEDSENPMLMETLLTRLGAEMLDWPFKTECCGGSLSVPRKDLVAKLSDILLSQAARYGAEAVVTPCSMCFMNLDRQNDARAPKPPVIPVFSLAELLLLALAPDRAKPYLGGHLGDPFPLLVRRGLA